MYDIYLPVSVAAVYSKIPIPIWLNLIKCGLVPTLVDSIPEGVTASELATILHIPVSFLPRASAEAYLKDYLLKASCFSIDFIGFKERYGEARFEGLLRELTMFKAALHICRAVPVRRQTRYLTAFAMDNGISLSTFYRKEAIIMSCDLKKLIHPPHVYHTNRLCLLARDYLRHRYCLPNHPSQNQLRRDLEQEALSCGAAICDTCVYNEASKNRAKQFRRHPSELPVCPNVGSGMLFPDNRYPVNRFIATLSEQEVAYGQQGPEFWMESYAPKTVRNRAEKVNAVWFGDHHLADVVVIAKHDEKTGKDILARPWLTVCTDSASSAIVGSVVTLRPNSLTIAECFCRAAAFTVDSPFHGLPEVFYVDRGKDYRSKLLEGDDPEFRVRTDTASYFNRAFCGNPLLCALNVTVLHAMPRTGRSKTIERTFGTVTRSAFSQLPGWTGNCPSARPFDFAKEKKALLEKGGLWTLEKFARYWFEEVVPAYNHQVWSDTSEGSVSPQALYDTLPRANTLTPDWNTLAVFKAKKSKHKVHANGIHYRGEYYWHPLLQDYITRKGKDAKYVQIYDFDQSFCHSITVLFHGAYVCEAYPRVHHDVVEADRLKLIHHLEEQKSAKRLISRRVTKVRMTLSASGIAVNRYVEYNPASDLPEETAYAEEIDSERDQQSAIMLSETANAISATVKAQQKVIERIVYGPKDEPLSEFYTKLGAETKPNKTNISAPTPTLSRDQDI